MHSTIVDRFVASMPLQLDRWRDGSGYDLDGLHEATAAEVQAIESILLSQPGEDWRDIEALATLATPRACERLQHLLLHGSLLTALRVMRYAPHHVEPSLAQSLLIKSFAPGAPADVVSLAADLLAPPVEEPVVKAIFDHLDHCDGTTAYDLGAILLVCHGLLTSRWDMNERALLLTLTDDDPAMRRRAIDDLMARCGRLTHRT